MREDKILDFLSANFLSTAVNKVLFPPFYHVVPGWVLPHQVPRPVKTIGGKSAGVVLRHAEVATQRVGAPATQLANGTERYLRIVLIHDSHFVIRRHRPAHSFETNICWVPASNQHQQSFVHSKVYMNKDIGD